MALDRYQRRRDFTKTPEPPGAPGPATPPSPGSRFVVQRHRARRLHYDLRLEIDGVLASWAVPRGPTLDADARRMAVHVEDHPLDYFDFEGVIPEAQYGAGDAIVWDWGTYQPEATADPGTAVRDGELKFRLHGEKLSGRFTLVRTGGRAAGSADDPERSWLLVKKRDEAAVAGWDPESHPRSVKSGRTNDEVAGGGAAAWDAGVPADRGVSADRGVPTDRGVPDLAAARVAPMPDFIAPMQATLAAAAFDDPGWLFEVKWDGYRVEAVIRAGRVTLWTRNRQDAARYFPRLAATPDWISAREAIVDGEVVALRSDGTADFSLLQAATGPRGSAAAAASRTGVPGARGETRDAIPLAYEVFDLLYLDGRSLLDVPLEDRKRLLRAVLREHPVVRYAGHVEADGEAFFHAAAERGVEGVVAKLRRGRYEPGRRSRSWLKVKVRPEQELVIGGYVPGRGRSADLGALLVGVHEGGTLRYAGRVGSGFDGASRTALLSRLDPLRRADPPFANPPHLVGARWTEPRTVVRVEFAEWTADGMVRQAAYRGLEPDRDPANVIRERPVRGPRVTVGRSAVGVKSSGRPPVPPGDPSASSGQAFAGPTPDELAALDRVPARGGRWRVGDHEVALTNLDRVLFPAAGLTKRDLIRYYATIAPVLLPYLAGRALNLSRWPVGVEGPHFWQREIPARAPAWVSRHYLAGRTAEDSHTYIVADDVATLAWLANQAAIEIHPWTSLAATPDRPTYALIDVDPGERTAWEETRLLARLYGDALRHLGVVGYPKTTGKRGIQVWIPIAPRYTFDETRAWVEQVSRAVGATVPDLVSWEWERAARGGLARLDYTQNAPTKTLVGPYVVRARPDASVSAPLAWDELDDPGLRPDRWTLQTIGERLATRGDLFRGVLGEGQELPRL